MPTEQEYRYMEEERKVPLTLYRGFAVLLLLSLACLGFVALYLYGAFVEFPDWYPAPEGSALFLLAPFLALMAWAGVNLLSVGFRFARAFLSLRQDLRESTGEGPPILLRLMHWDPSVVEQARRDQEEEMDRVIREAEELLERISKEHPEYEIDNSPHTPPQDERLKYFRR